MTTYPSLDESCDAIWKTAGEWQKDFSNMTFEEFHEFFEHAFHNRLASAIENGVGRKYVLFRLSMLASLCQKMLESAHFLDGVTQEFRKATEDIANQHFDLLISLCDEKNNTAIKRAWKATEDYCARFGYKSGAVFEVLAPHRVFSCGT